MIARLRLIDAVAIAAGAMLFLKVIGIASGSHASDRRQDVGQSGIAEQDKSFARALSNARTNFVPEVKITGSVPAAEPKGAPPPKPSAPEPAVERSPVPPSPSERALLERLGERREEMQQKGKDLEMRERLLEDAERKLESRINELKAVEEKTEGVKRGDVDSPGLKNLVIMYEAMKPKEAARVFDRLSHDVLVPVVLQMNPRKMSEVLAVMAPETAERLTVALANRAKGKTEVPGAGVAPALPSKELPAIDPAPRR